MFGSVLSFFTAGPARIQALLIGALAIAATCLAIGGWALLERSWRFEAERDGAKVLVGLKLALARGDVLAESVKACTAGVELARQAGEDGRKVGARLMTEARRLNAGNVATVTALEALLERPEKPGATCEDAWREIEQLRAKAKAAP